MGLGRFLRGESDEPTSSAFDSITDEHRQYIANDIAAMVECIKHWKVIAQSPEHAKALLDEGKTALFRLIGKFSSAALTGALTGKDEMPDIDPESLALPEAVKDIIRRVKAQLKDEETDNGSPPVTP